MGATAAQRLRSLEARGACRRVTVVLLYHDVVVAADRDRVGFPGRPAARYKLEPHIFEGHLDAIAGTGAAVGVVSVDGIPPAATLSFDDAGASALAVAAAVEARGWRAHFFVPTARLGTAGFLDRGEVRELANRGHAIGSHSHTHPAYMGRLSAARVVDEWRRSREILAQVLGAEPQIASIPGGSLSRTVVEGAAEAGYRILMTSEPTMRVSHAGPLLLIGRFAIWDTTPAARAAAYVEAVRGARLRLWLEWNGKKLAKRASAPLYERLRQVRSRFA
jgi:peptidoglycan/xylan/chitin deacetylase (PgdA/CDA1 family)